MAPKRHGPHGRHAPYHITIPIPSAVLLEVPAIRARSQRRLYTLSLFSTREHTPHTPTGFFFLLSPLVWLSAFHFTSLITVHEYRRHNTFSLKSNPITCHPGGIDGDHPFQVLRSPVPCGQRLPSLPRLAQCRLQARLTPHNRTLAGPPPDLPWPRPAQKQPITTCPRTAPTAPTSTAVFRALHSTRTTGR